MRIRSIHLVLLAGALAVSIGACSNPFQAKSAKPAGSSSASLSRLVLTVNGLPLAGQAKAKASAKSIMPDPSGLIESYQATIHNEADGSSTANDMAVELDASVTTVELAADTYDVTVLGYTQPSGGGNAIVSGTSAGVAVSSGTTASVTVSLSPIMSGGSGSIDFKLSFPKGLVDGVSASFDGNPVTLSIANDPSNASNSKVELSKSTYPVGTYVYLVQLKKSGNVLATYMDSIWVAANLATTGTTTLVAANFGAAPVSPADLQLAPQLPAQTGNAGPGMLVEWTDVSAVEENYLVYRSLSASSGYALKATLPAGSTSFLDTGLSDQTTYYYQVTAKNRFGESAPATASATAYASSPAASMVAAGKTALEAKNFDLAYSDFTQAAKADPANTEALVYAALVGISSIYVDSTVVDLMKNRIGLSSYPSTMNTLFSQDWFNEDWYSTREGPVLVQNPSEGGYYFVRGTFTSSKLRLLCQLLRLELEVLLLTGYLHSERQRALLLRRLLRRRQLDQPESLDPARVHLLH